MRWHEEVCELESSPEERFSPVRQCLVSRVSQTQVCMLRFVIGPDEWVVPDVDAKLPGRGFWLSARRDMVETAMTKQVFAKVARRSVSVPVDLADRVDRLLARRVLDLVGLTRRAGALLCGYEKVITALKSGRVACLIEACDAASGGNEKIRRLSGDLPVISLFGRTELGTAVGRENVVHIAVKADRIVKVLLLEANRLACYRGLGQYENEPLPQMKDKARAT